ncbi:MCE family protein [Nocardioides immobilis]|uniref:MCE family protein n=1 Tax=Nocardioides immobilis TaxID=2049295 RepID=A0A417Y701_9ACTN|nr:MlaD family protein [Nocardioides immobilis]RHW28522.1 MCE family protein [Nocardioides immobilis]
MRTTSKRLIRRAPRSPKAVGVAVLVGLLLFSLGAFNRSRVETVMTPGESLSAEFSQAYKLVPYQSVVKLAGVQVGTVTDVERSEGRRAVVEMKLDHGTLEKLGTAPSANVRPTLVLGGTYYVELVRGGRAGATDEGATIPVDHTSVPVELDKVLSAVTPSASEAVRGTIASLDETLDRTGRRTVRDLVTSAPGTLGPAADVLDALTGTTPRTDLTGLVTGLQHTADALTRDRGRLTSIIDGLATSTAALADERAALTATIAQGPETARITQAGLADLDETLDRLRTTAEDFRPAAQTLGPLLADLDPVLVDARPVIADARVVAREARPLVEVLVPGTVRATDVLSDVRGPVLNRLTGPVTSAVLSPWHGTGTYQGGGNDHLLYEEAGYLLSHTADVFKFHDHNGAHGRLMAGIGLSTPGGVVGMSFEQYLEVLGYQLPEGPQEGANDDESPPLGLQPDQTDQNGPAGLPSGDLVPLDLPLVTGGDR